jgi:FkbM family methyltransferase
MQAASTSDITDSSNLLIHVKELCADAIKLVNAGDFSSLLNRLDQCSMKYPATSRFFPRLRTAQVICLECLGRLEESLELARNNLSCTTYDPELIELIVKIRTDLYIRNFKGLEQAIQKDHSLYKTFNFGQFTMSLDPLERGSIYTMACCQADIFEPFEKGIFGEIICGNPDCLIIDIGASYGVYTLFACNLVSHKFGRKVVAVEPDRRVFEKLSESVSNNGFEEDTILINKAVSDIAEKQVTFFVNASGSVDNRSFTHGQIQVSDSYDVDAVTIDSIIADVEKNGIKPQTIIVKMDIQGNEPRAIRGMSKTLSDYKSIAILLELDDEMLRDAGLNSSKFAEELFALGFDKIADINETAQSIRFLDKIEDLLEVISNCNRYRSVNQWDPRRYTNLLCYRDIDWSFPAPQSDNRDTIGSMDWIKSFSHEQRLLFIVYETLMAITLSGY